MLYAHNIRMVLAYDVYKTYDYIFKSVVIKNISKHIVSSCTFPKTKLKNMLATWITLFRKK